MTVPATLCDALFILLMVLLAGGLSAGCLACSLAAGPSSPWGWLALLPVPAFAALAALPVRSNRVELWADRLVIVYAGTRSAIPYAHVRGVRRTRTLWAGTANRSTASSSRRPTTGTPSSR